MNAIVFNKIGELKGICENHHVESMYVFGSACTEHFTDKSDIDLLVNFKKIDLADYADNFFRLIEELENLFGRKVDLITGNSLSNPYFIKTLEKTKTQVYAA